MGTKDSLRKIIADFQQIIKDKGYFFENELTALDEKLDEDVFRLAVVGEYSTGKSTFINALIGQDLLLHMKREATATITYIHNVPKNSDKIGKCEIYYHTGEKKELDNLHDLAKYTTTKSDVDVVREIAHVDVYVNFMGTDVPIIITDTPGLNGMAEGHKEITIGEIKKAHACIYLFSIKGITAYDVTFICEGRDDEGLSDRNQFQKYVFVCSFPYETEIMKKLIGQGIQIRQKDLNTELLYVIYKRNLRTGATDLDVKDDVIKEIKKEYNKKIMVEVYDEKSSRKQVFMSHMNLVHCISWDYTEKCKNEIKRIEDRVEEKKKDYDNIERPAIEKEGYGDPQRMEQSVKSFRKLKTGMDIMEQYLSNYITSKMYKRGENIILNFYRRIFSSDILLWSIDEEYEIMKKEMKKMLERKVLSCNKKEIIPADEMEFRKVLSKTNIHTDFARLLDEYYRNDIKEYIFDRIQQKMKKLREYLDFNEEENE